MTSRGTKYWNSGAIPLIAPEILGNIISEVSDLALVVNDKGQVLSVLVNPNQDSFKDLERWEGEKLQSFLTVESIPKFESRLESFLTSDATVRPVELNHIDDAQHWEFPVRYSFHRIGPDGAVLMLGRDLRPVAEMQHQLVNAQLALERDYETQRQYETRFRVLMEASGEAMVFVSLQSGKMTDGNPAAARLLDASTDAFGKADFAQFFAPTDDLNLVGTLNSQAMSDSIQPVNLHLAQGGEEVAVHATVFRAAGERVMLCRILPKDSAAPVVDTQSENLRSLFIRSSDAIVFTSADGLITAANESFLDLVGHAEDTGVRGRPLADFMQRGTVDFKVMVENTNRAGRMRTYATKVAGDYGSPRAVEMSVTILNAPGQQLYAFVMREAGRQDTGARVTPEADEPMQSVVELVGSATLKDIVAETTNVVEKMCIETAVELTMNNRVAAAEMLGLSRQSLYVKLRKFGIMDRDS